MNTQRRFKYQPTGPYMAAVAALERLLEYEDCDAAERAFAEAVYRAREKRLLAAGLKLTAGTRCMHKLLHEKHSKWHAMHDCRPPGDDHGKMYRRDGAWYYKSEPYYLDIGSLKEIVALCESKNLYCVIDAGASTHFPSRTISVMYSREEDRPGRLSI